MFFFFPCTSHASFIDVLSMLHCSRYNVMHLPAILKLCIFTPMHTTVIVTTTTVPVLQSQNDRTTHCKSCIPFFRLSSGLRGTIASCLPLVWLACGTASCALRTGPKASGRSHTLLSIVMQKFKSAVKSGITMWTQCDVWYTDENRHYQTEVTVYFLGKIGFLPYL